MPFSYSKRSKALRFVMFFFLMLVCVAAYRWWFSVPRDLNYVETIELPRKSVLRFLVVGDTGTGDEAQWRVAHAMEQVCLDHETDGILLLGDNFYQKGVRSVQDPQWDEKVFGPYGLPCLKTLPIFAVLGNHDYKGNVQAQIQMTNTRERWVLPHRFYRVEFGNLLQIIAIDTNEIGWCFNPHLCVMDFLRDALDQRRDFHWTIAMGHHPIGNASEKYGDASHVALHLRGWILKRTLCGKSDAYVAGHTHHLEYRQEEGCETDLVISGAGGGELSGVNKADPSARFAESVNGFVLLTVADRAMAWQFYDANGRELRAFTRDRPVRENEGL